MRPRDIAAPPSISLTAGSMVSAARRGDRAAWEHLHEKFGPMVHGVLLARVPRQEADDLTQEVFVHAMGKIKALKDDQAFGPWLATIARNLAASFHRSRRPAISLDGGDELPLMPQASADSTLPAEDLLKARVILSAIRSLPEAYCETLVLRLVEGLTGPQISACTGMTPGSVRVNLHRGMQLLRAKLGLDEEVSGMP